MSKTFITVSPQRACLALAICICVILAGASAITAPAASTSSAPSADGKDKKNLPAGGPVAGVNVNYAHAGIGLAVPSGMESQILREPYDLARFVRMERNKPVLAVAIQAFPIADHVAAGDFADAMTAEVQKNLAISRLSVARKGTISVAGMEGQLRVLNYIFRGGATSAGRVFFTREENLSPSDGKADQAERAEKIRLCYVLTVELPSERQSAMDAILAGLAGSVKLTAIRQPMDSPITEFQQIVNDYKLGYSIRPPRAWYIDTAEGGAVMAQTDYLLGGVPMPMVQVMAVDSGGVTTSRQYAATAIDQLQKTAAGEGEEIKVISQKQSNLAGLDAWQVVLEQRMAASQPAADDGQPPATIVQRTVIFQGPSPSSTPRAYSLRLYCQTRQIGAAEELMEKLAGEFALIDTATAFAAASQPAASQATQPASSTMPATTEPAAAVR